MKNVALIFPGQGVQKVGMGLEFYQTSAQAKAIFDQADQICGHNLSKVIFEGSEEQLTSTAYCQPAILTMSIAALKALEASAKFKSVKVMFTSGLSLGEYSALTAAGVMSFEETLRLVQKRSAYMEEATKEAEGAMSAVIGFDKNKLLEICQSTGAEVANFNSNEQIVITGHKLKVEAAMEAIKAAGGTKIIPLVVSGAFHSSLMKGASLKFESALKEAKITPRSIGVVTNVNAQVQTTADEIRFNLAKQITASVRWVECVEYMASQGITDFIEIGPGKVLKGLIRRINPNLAVHNIEKPADIEALFS